jgi:hypothetical protein
MPQPKTDITKLAEAHGITYHCARYRMMKGIPLDAPPMRNGNAKAWATRRARQTPEERAAIQARKVERERRRVERQRLKRQREASKPKGKPMGPREPDQSPVVAAAPRQQWQNPFAAMAVR